MNPLTKKTEEKYYLRFKDDKQGFMHLDHDYKAGKVNYAIKPTYIGAAEFTLQEARNFIQFTKLHRLEIINVKDVTDRIFNLNLKK